MSPTSLKTKKVIANDGNNLTEWDKNSMESCAYLFRKIEV